MKTNPTRLEYLDLLRVFGCIAVVTLHAAGLNGTVYGYSAEWFVQNILDSFSIWAVPLFVMISGALLLNTDKQESLSEFYKRRLVKIGIPLLIWIPFYIVFYHFARGDSLSYFSLWNKISSGSFDHLYFLVLILELYVLTPVLNKLLASKRVSLSFCTALAILLGFVWKRVGFTPTMFVPFLGYYFLGSYVRSLKKDFAPRLLTLLLFLGTATIFTLSYVFSFVIPSPHIIDTFVYYSSGPLILGVALCLFLSIKQLPSSHQFQRIAETSLGIYILHPLILSLSWIVLSSVFHLTTYPWYLMILFIPLGLAISYAFVRLMKMIPLIKYVV
jgi:surface polysaccharide O-acyltransferase-like enzyme